MSRVAEWSPVFPEPVPEHWVALVQMPTIVSVLSDEALAPAGSRWLADWLSLYNPRDPDLTASVSHG